MSKESRATHRARGNCPPVYPPLDAHKRRETAILNTWEGMGVEVVTRAGIHHKAAIIDRVIAWEGSLNILQHWKSKEHMTRHEDAEYISQLMDVLGVE